MRIEALRTLETVLRTGSFASAAAALHLTPSAVSLQMKQLESYLGQLLFDRSGRGTRPTAFARRFVADASGFLAHIESLRGGRPRTVSGVLRTGMIANVEKSSFPRALRLLHERYPHLRIQPTLGVSAELIEGVKAGRFDAAVVVQPPRGSSTRLCWIELIKESFVMIAPPDALGTTPRQLLQSHPWVRYDVSLTGGRLAADYIRRILPGCTSQYELTSTDAVLAMVAEGLGVSVVPRPRAPLLAGYPVRLIDLGPRAPVRTIAIVARRADAEDRRLQALAEGMREACAFIGQG